jgi:hypothetical protein
MDQILEQWRPVPGYEHGYEVSDQGNVRSLYRGGRLLKPATNRGYKQVVLYAPDGMTTKGHTVHRLVAAAFIPNPQELPWVNHINGRKDDNRASNLEWCDRQGNVRHAVDHGLMASQAGASNGNAKFSDRERRVIYRLSEIGFSQKAIAEMFESPQGTVQKVIAAGNCC